MTQRAQGTAAAGEPGLLERARALAPLIEAAAWETERNGALSPPLLAALHEAKLFRMLLPRSIGGLEVEPAVFIEVLEALAGADASTAWVVAQGCGSSFAAAYLAPEIAREVFGPADAVLAWGPSSAGAARAVAVDGGFRISGRWPFASGIRHAPWLGGHCTVFGPEGTARPGAGGGPLERTAVFPRSAARIEETWQVIGLKGTGSHTYAVEDLFVPHAYTFQREAPAERREPGSLYRFNGMSIFAFGVAAMALGLARPMLAAFVGVAQAKVDRATGQPLKDSAAVQCNLARAEAKLLSARAFLMQTAHDVQAAAAGGRAFSIDERARIRLSTVWAATLGREVADFAYTAAGSAAIFEAGPFERRFRDMHTLAQQVQAHASNFELVGQALLGVPTTSRLI